ncbi:SCO7613 C-terminal domain-containing membrane protein [Cryobacterium sp. TMT1-3]
MLFLLVREVLFATDAVASVFTLAPPAVALVVCSLALFRGSVSIGTAATGTAADNERVDRFARRDRIALEIGAAFVLVPAAVTAAITFRSLGWLVIVLAGIVALIMAIAPDGLFGSQSNRRHLGWLALALGTAGLWLGLARAGTVALEPYVVPVAGVVLVTAALIRRYGRIDRASAASPVAALLTLAGLLIALAPLALAAQSGSLVRAVVVALLAAALVLGAGAVQWSPPRSHYLAAAGLAGSVALVVTAVVQTQRLRGAPGAPDARLELWLLLPAAVAVATAFLLARQADAASAPLRRGASIATVLVWASVVTWIELAVAISPADAGLSTPRALLLVVALSAVHVLALWHPHPPFGARTAWGVLALAGLAAFTAATFGVVDPFELVTVPVALALLGSGWLRLRSDPRARSWPWTGPGLLLLLVPSLLLDLTYSDLWRIVSLGVVAIIVLVIGSTRRLQAPFMIGAVVLLIHGIAQLWPWIALAYSVIPWFLWLGGGGIVLIVLAARYEQRIANLKSVALRISALR